MLLSCQNGQMLWSVWKEAETRYQQGKFTSYISSDIRKIWTSQYIRQGLALQKNHYANVKNFIFNGLGLGLLKFFGSLELSFLHKHGVPACPQILPAWIQLSKDRWKVFYINKDGLGSQEKRLWESRSSRKRSRHCRRFPLYWNVTFIFNCEIHEKTYFFTCIWFSLL